MQVGVIKDVGHRDPWVPYMSEIMPAGALVVVLGKERSGSLLVCDSEERLSRGDREAWYAHPSSVEILGDL